MSNVTKPNVDVIVDVDVDVSVPRSNGHDYVYVYVYDYVETVCALQRVRSGLQPQVRRIGRQGRLSPVGVQRIAQFEHVAALVAGRPAGWVPAGHRNRPAAIRTQSTNLHAHSSKRHTDPALISSAGAARFRNNSR